MVSSGSLLIAALLAGVVAADHEPPRVNVDLGIDPEHRWDHVVAAYKNTMNEAFDTILSAPGVKKVVPAARLLLGNAFEARRLLTREQYLEAKGIARAMGRPAADLVLIASFYDLFAAKSVAYGYHKACTGIVAQSDSGEIFHGRNLDYNFVDPLGKATLVVDFVKQNKTLFTAVTFGANPSFNTFVRHGAFSLTHDERDTGSVFENLWDMLILGRAVTFTKIREAAETLSSFDDAVHFFSNTELDASSYFILGGVQAGEGAVVTRGRHALVDVWRLDASLGRWYVLETNYDHTKQPAQGDDRRRPLQRAMNATGSNGFNASSMWDVISLTHVNKSAGERSPLNSMTIYSTVMQAAKPDTFKTVVRSHSSRVV